MMFHRRSNILVPTIRAFPSSFVKIFYFIFSKSYFSTLANYFYNTPHIPFSILQSFYLNILSLFLFANFFITLSLLLSLPFFFFW
jgi:hypothetical protein